MALYLPPRARRIAAAIAALVVFLALVGATYQGVATALERRRYQRPGGLVDVGGHQLHIYCVGRGSPVVVLEAGAGSMSSAWGWVQPQLAVATRVCSYDRAGLGWSEAGDGIYAPSRVPRELHALLDQANEKGPFVMVGHELGSAFARVFAAQYPSDIAALVFVDDALAESGPMPASMVSAWPWLARAGILRATDRLSSRALGLPGDAGGAMRAFLNRPDHLTRAAQEIARLEEAKAAARGITLDAALPVTSVSTGGRGRPAMLVSREDAASVLRAIQAMVVRLRDENASRLDRPER